jgi:DeoR/GlpR family transcriptional regulator of sugar metabolism
VQVSLELAALEDQELLGAKGLAAMREGRLARLARQAQVQGGLLTIEDLAYLTCSSTATVKRDLAACRAKDVAVPTRGQIRDIGPGVSHKAQIVQLYL